jgi:Zn ribbon nucleic-acid-binding protein
MLMWNDSTIALVSCPTCGMLQLSIHSTLPPYVSNGIQDIQWIEMHWGIWLP